MQKLGSFNLKSIGAVGLILTLTWWSSAIAKESSSKYKASVVSITKVTAAELPTHESMMVTQLRQIKMTDPEPDLVPSLCINGDLEGHHLSIDDEVKLTGVMDGRTVQAKVETYKSKEKGNTCGGSLMMITTDLSNLEGLESDLYTGTLNITISPE